MNSQPYGTNQMTHYQVVARKYRPQTFKEVLGQDPIVRTLKNALKSGKSAHAYLFCGSRGTGKTTLARILAKALNCTNLTENLEPCNSCSSCREITSGSSLDVMEIDGASHRGIDDIKQISESVGYCPTNGKYKVYLIDEVHMLTKEAFNALLKTLEEPPENVKFFFATTEAHKIPATILSRCQRFNLSRIPQAAIISKLKNIAADMNVTVDESALLRLTGFAEGGLRDAESLFDQMIAFSEGKITEEVVQEVLGVMPRDQFFALDEATQTGDITVAFNLANAIFCQGKEISHFLEDLNAHIKAILLTKLGCQELLTDLDPVYRQGIQQSAEKYTQEQCLNIFDLIQDTASNIKNAPSPHMALEALLLRIVRIRQKISIEAIARRLVQLEEKLSGSKGPTPPPTSPTQQKQTPVAPVKPQPIELPKVPDSTPPPVMADDVQTNARLDTLIQFAAVELDGTAQRKRRK
ncbi:MAG: DNA polymerase III subunit gamma/tau [Chlamydiales bacterium]|nr:DNA polymerase III subunit gamma/tau [Chlamydiales bacterium]